MTLSEKSAYLKGLMDGMKLDTEKNEGKLLAAMVDLLNDMALSISDLEENAQAVSDELDMIEESLDTIEDYLDDEDYEDEEDDYEDEDDYDEEEDDDAYDFGDETLYEVKCPTCGEVITIDEATLEEGGIVCPQCGEDLEFDEVEENEEEE